MLLMLIGGHQTSSYASHLSSKYNS